MKYFEIRDDGTFIPAAAFKPIAGDAHQNYLISHAGFGKTVTEQENYVILVKLDPIEAQYDPYEWGNSRTMRIAHDYIIRHWDDLESGAVIDVEYIIGDRDTPKLSQMIG